MNISAADLADLRSELDAPYSLPRRQVAFYNENGYVRLKHVFSRRLLEHYRSITSDFVAQHSKDIPPLEQRTTYGKAFLQLMNLWTQSAQVKEFVFGKRLARIAAELMSVSGVRIYHDQALYKEAGGGITPWHADQHYWPVSSDKMITAWVPLQDTPHGMGPLAFAEQSHRLQAGRHLEIGDESEMSLKKALRELRVEESPFELGEVSFHAGWTFHRAGANTTNQLRAVMTVIYMDEAMPKNQSQVNDTERWCPGVRVGEIVGSPLNPILYSEHT